MSKTTTCPVSGCSRQMEKTLAMCPACWAKLPDESRKKLVDIYSRAKGTRSHLEILHDCIKIVENLSAQPKLEL